MVIQFDYKFFRGLIEGSKSILTLLQKEFPQILQCRWNLGAFLLLLLPIKKGSKVYMF